MVRDTALNTPTFEGKREEITEACHFKGFDSDESDMTKRERLDAYLGDHDLDAVWFARPNSFAWLTGGSNVVNRESDVGVAAVGYDGDSLEVVTNNIEAERLREEELSGNEEHLPERVSISTFEWHEQTLAEAVADHSPEPAAADFDVPGFESVNVSPLRQPLTESDIETYRELGQETAAAVEAVCRELQPGDTELEVAAALRIALSAQDIEVPVALVGGAERARRYRHYTPTEAQLGGYVLVSVTAERDGLHASATRTVAFESEIDTEELTQLRERHDAARTVEATALATTQAVATRGGSASSVFSAIQDTYESVGYPEEWREHHQGGAAGFAGREWVATPDSDAAVTTPMAYAWNPTVQGAKSEDTVLVTAEEFEVLTDTGQWPTTTVEAEGYDRAVKRPDLLVV